MPDDNQPSDIVRPANSKLASAAKLVLISRIPIVGPAAATAMSAWLNESEHQRMSAFMEELSRKVDECGVLISSSRHFTDDELALLENVIGLASKESRESKRNRLARVIATQWTKPSTASTDETELFVEAVMHFSELHVRVLAVLNEAKHGAPVPYSRIQDHFEFKKASLTGTTKPIPDYDLIRVMDDLATRYGMITRGWLNSGAVSTGNLSPEGIARGCNHTITERGIRFLDSILDERDSE